jgi:hypothetical protein
MAEQVSFYDKLKSDVSEFAVDEEARRKREAAARFATDAELARDETLLEGFVRDTTEKGRAAAAEPAAAFRSMGMEVPSSMRPEENAADFFAAFDDVEDRLASERGQTDLAYRRNLLGQRNELMRAARQPSRFGMSISPFSAASLALYETASNEAIDASMDPRTEELYARKLLRMKRDPEKFKPAPDFEKRFDEAIVARRRLRQAEQMPPGPARDDAMMSARQAARKAAQAVEDASPQRRRRQERKALPPAGEQLDLYRRAKQAAESYGTEAVSAAKKALGSPALKRGLAVGAGILGSKAGMAATSGGADLVAELAVGVPKAFIEGYNRSQEPYEQVKYVAEAQGPIDKLQPKTLSSLGYSDALRLRDEGHLTSGAVEQLRQHVMREEGFDPQQVLRDMDRSVTSGSR